MSDVRVLPLLPENYTYEHFNQTDYVLNYKFTVDEIKSKEDFKTWKMKFETANKQNFSIRHTNPASHVYKYKCWLICKHAERARHQPHEKYVTKMQTHKKRVDAIEE